MVNYLTEHPHLLTALGLSKEPPTRNEVCATKPDDTFPSNVSSKPEINQVDDSLENSNLDPLSRESQDTKISDDTTTSTTGTTEDIRVVKTPTVSAPNADRMHADDDKIGLNTEKVNNTKSSSNNKTTLNQPIEVDSSNSNSNSERILDNYLEALTLKRKICVNVSADETDLWLSTKMKKTEPKVEHGLYFTRIGEQILRPRRRSYNTTRNR